MNYRFPPDVEQLVKNQMAAGHYESEDDLLRDALTAFQKSRHVVIEEDPIVVQGVRRGLDEMKQGLGRPYEAFDREFRAKHDIPRDELVSGDSATGRVAGHRLDFPVDSRAVPGGCESVASQAR